MLPLCEDLRTRLVPARALPSPGTTHLSSHASCRALQEQRRLSALPQNQQLWAVAWSWLGTAVSLPLPTAPPLGAEDCFNSPLPVQRGHGALDEFPPPKRT